MIDSCAFEPKSLLTIDQALEKITAAIRPVRDSESVDIKNARGRILSQSLYSPINIPSDRNSAMDGYAFSSRDIVDKQAFTLDLAGISLAGRPFQGQLQAGQCVRILTGAVVPEQADSVVMQEQVTVNGQNIHFPAQTKIKQNIRAAGEDVRQHGLLYAHPKKLTAIDIGLLAAAGIAEIPVKRRLKIAFFSTGDELTAAGHPLATGKIYDSNRYLLNALLEDECFSLVDGGVLADDKAQLKHALVRAADNFDVIITTGGASVGEADYIKEILESCGTINFWKIAIKPGKPLAFGNIGACHFFGLPGNPVAVLTTFQQIVAPALKQLSGAHFEKPLRLTAMSTSALKKSPGRQEFQRGILSQSDSGEFFVSSPGKQDSHILSSMTQANCYIVLPAECSGVTVGDKVMVEPFSLYI